MQDYVCISIGIDRYSQPEWPGNLSYASQDAIWFANLANRSGVHKRNIRLLLNEKATRQSILWSIRTWPRDIGSRAQTVILYFAGHGLSGREGADAKRSYLLPHDVSIEDPISNGIELHELVSALRSLTPKSVFIFLDACHQDIGALFDRHDLRILLRDITDDVCGCLFAMVGGHLRPTYEGGGVHGGKFTSLLLDTLDRLDRLGNRTIDQLARLAMHDTNSDSGIRVVHIGSTSAWPFPTTAGEGLASDIHEPNAVFMRREQIRKLTAILRTKPGITRILWAKALSGKSVFLQQLTSELPFAIYLSCNSNEMSETVLLERVVAEFIAQFPGAFFSSDTPAFGVDVLSSLSKSGRAWLMLDHIERIGINRLRLIAERLSKFGIDIIAATRTRELAAPREEWIRLEPFSESEITEWYMAQGISAVEATQAGIILAGKSPEAIQRTLAARIGKFVDDDSLQRDVACRRFMLLTSGFGNLDLFLHHFEIDPLIGRHLLDSPLVSRISYWHHLHDKLFEDLDEIFTEDEIDRAIRYLCLEIDDNPSNSFAAEQLCRIVEQQVRAIPQWDHSISRAIDVLVHYQHHERILSLATKLAPSSSNLSTVSLSILSWASDRGISRQFSSWLTQRSDAYDIAESLVMMARLSWWEGKLHECISFAAKAADLATIANPGLVGAARLELGIGHFFLGNWIEAIETFSELETSVFVSARTRHWARAMKGTALGLRGISVVVSLDNLSRAAESLARLGDFVGAGIAYGNAGEIACKAGYLEQSMSLLDMGLRIATVQQAQINVLENNRVRAHLAIRLFGPGSQQVREIRVKLYEGLKHLDSDMERMQVQNSLATIALLENEDEEASRLIDMNERLVVGNSEYEIYWCWNRSMLCAKHGDEAGSAREFTRGLLLAQRGNNLLAIQQYVEEAKLLTRVPREAVNKIIRLNISTQAFNEDLLQ